MHPPCNEQISAIEHGPAAPSSETAGPARAGCVPSLKQRRPSPVRPAQHCRDALEQKCPPLPRGKEKRWGGPEALRRGGRFPPDRVRPV